jgi:L-ribulokinase
LGAAIFASVAAGAGAEGYDSVAEAQKAMVGIGRDYLPVEENHRIYRKLYALYRRLHDAFGMRHWSGSMYDVMKELLDIRDAVRRSR